MRCDNHAQAEAKGACACCGKPYCKECLAEIRGKYYCKEHASHAFDEPAVSYPYEAYDGYPYRSRLTAALLCLFLGYLGIHRFYAGKVGTGIIWFFSFGFCGVGWLLDLVLIVLGLFKDREGRPLM